MQERIDGNPTYEGTERRNKGTSVTKEINVSWLVTFVLGGIANFASIIWIAATLVSDVGALKLMVGDHARYFNEARLEKERQLLQNATQDSRLNVHDQVLITHGERITNIERRVYR